MPTKIDNYTMGRDIEFMVIKVLNLFGWESKISPGSRGIFDIRSIKNRKKFGIQVKYRTNGSALSTIASEKCQILEYSKTSNYTPVLAFVTRNSFILSSSRYHRDPKNNFLILDQQDQLIWIQIGTDFILQFVNIKTTKCLGIGELYG